MIYTVTLNPAVDKELVVPAIEVDKVLRSREARLDFGGKDFNVSRRCCSLEGTCCYGLRRGHKVKFCRRGNHGHMRHANQPYGLHRLVAANRRRSKLARLMVDAAIQPPELCLHKQTLAENTTGVKSGHLW